MADNSFDALVEKFFLFFLLGPLYLLNFLLKLLIGYLKRKYDSDQGDKAEF